MSSKRYPYINSKLPCFIHGADYNPDQWLECESILQEDMRLAKLANINALSIGIFSWSSLESKDGIYSFDWLDSVMDMLAENNIYAILSTPSGARPPWMSQKYPEVLRVNANRRRNLFGMRHNHCMTSPVYRKKVMDINTRLAERYKDHKALLAWHVSNEYSGSDDEGQCHCDLCQEKFREYLQSKYKTLDNLNHSWWNYFWSHQYTDWSQIESPSPIGETRVHGLVLDWKRFTSSQYTDFFEHEIVPLRKHTPNIPITTNLMGTYPNINPFDIGNHLDFVSFDNYPFWRGDEKDIDVAIRSGFGYDLMRGTGNGKPFLLMESCPSATNWSPATKLLRTGAHKLYAMQAVAHGSDSVQYFQFRKSRGASEKFHGAVVDHEGSENTRVFKEVADVGKTLSQIQDIAATSYDSQVAIVYDFENMWALDASSGMLQNKNKYLETVIEHYSIFYKNGINVDIVDQTKDISSYEIVIAPMCYMLRGDFVDRVKSYVKEGGCFVATYITGYVNDTDLCFLGGFPGPLKEVLGIWCEELDSLYPEDKNALVYEGKEYEVYDFCEMIHTKYGAKKIATYKNDFYGGNPSVTCNQYGKGKSYFIGARTRTDFLDDFYKKLIDEYDIDKALECKLPHGVVATVRRDGETDYIFIMNYSATEKTVLLGKGTKYFDCMSKKDIITEVKLPIYGVSVLKKI